MSVRLLCRQHLPYKSASGNIIMRLLGWRKCAFSVPFLLCRVCFTNSCLSLFMPIYAYCCSSCGHTKDVLQKISDAPLTQCPACQEQTFSKQVTAADFQLKGSGWYATDFKGGDSSICNTASNSKAATKAPASACAACPNAPTT